MAKKSSPVSSKKEAPKMAKAPEKSKAVVSFVDAKALAPKGEGEKVVRELCRASAQIAEIEQRLDTEKMAKGAAISSMTQMIFNAAKADKRINLMVMHGEDKKAKNELNDRLRVVLGILEVRDNADGTQTRVQASWADEIFPRVGETAKKTNSDTFQARETNRANFAGRLREAAKAASTAVSQDIKLELDKASGLLIGTGKAVKEHFDQDKVIFNERQTFKSADGKKDITLKAKPSITELVRMGGGVVRQRGGAAPAQVNPANNEQVAAQIAKWQAIVEKLGRFDDTVATALDNLVEAIDNARERNEKLAKAA